MSISLFISDLHLEPGRPEGIELFQDFILQRAVDADQLFILGDLFEYWLGDDACKHSGYLPIAESLAALVDQNTKVFFMHGNRDFLVGPGFASSISGRLLPDPSVFRLDNLDVLLMHGDSLCTDDVEHQQFRAVTRSKQWQDDILAKSIAEREEIARLLRANSMQGNADKIESIMDVNQQTVESSMQQHKVRLMIHGHTHRTAIHEFQLGDSTAHRIVLGDWYKKGNYLVQDGTEFRLLSYPDDKLIATVDISDSSQTEAEQGTEKATAGKTHRA